MALPLGTTALEIASGLAVAVALYAIATGVRPRAELASPALLLAAGWMLLALGPGGDALSSLGRVWALCTIWTMPVLLEASGDEVAPKLLDLGLITTALLVPIVVGQRLLGLDPTGPYSHHLTLAYVLLPAFAAALGTGRNALALAIALGIATTGSAGAIVGAVTVAALLAVRSRGRIAMASAAAAGGIASLLGMPLLASDLAQRAVLWTAGARVAVRGGTPPGTWREVIAAEHRALDPAFHFPHHAHDAFLQAAGDAGPAAWVALAWAGWALWRRAPPWGLGLVAALLVGGLTQDWIGDMEVLRAVTLWATLALACGTAPPARVSVSP